MVEVYVFYKKALTAFAFFVADRLSFSNLLDEYYKIKPIYVKWNLSSSKSVDSNLSPFCIVNHSKLYEGSLLKVKYLPTKNLALIKAT